MTKVDAGSLALGAGFVLTTCGALWKAGQLRSDIFAKYKTQIDLDQAALDERAAVSLRKLAENVNRALGDLEGFDRHQGPQQVIADPSALQSQLLLVNRVLDARKKLPRYFRSMLRCGPVLMALLALLIGGILLALTYFSGWKRDRVAGYVGVWVSAGAVLLVALVSMYYFSLLHRFSSAEILSLDDSQ